MRYLAAELLAHRTDLRIGWDVRKVTLGPGPVYRVVDDQVEALDEHLSSIATAAVPPGKLLNASRDLRVMVVSDGADLVVRQDGVDVRVPAAGADSATPLAGGWLLVTAPVFDPGTPDGPTRFSSDHRVMLIDPEGMVTSETTLDVEAAVVSALAHPRDGSVILDAAQGQDGSAIYRVWADGNDLRVEHILEDIVAADFSPSGRRLLTTPYPGFGDPVRVLSWPDLTLLHELSGDVLDQDEDFDLYGCFLSESRIILSVLEALPLVCTADLLPEGRVTLPPDYRDAAPDTLFGLAENVFGMDLRFQYNSLAATAWRIPPAPGLS